MVENDNLDMLYLIFDSILAMSDRVMVILIPILIVTIFLEKISAISSYGSLSTGSEVTLTVNTSLFLGPFFDYFIVRKVHSRYLFMLTSSSAPVDLIVLIISVKRAACQLHTGIIDENININQ